MKKLIAILLPLLFALAARAQTHMVVNLANISGVNGSTTTGRVCFVQFLSSPGVQGNAVAISDKVKYTADANSSFTVSNIAVGTYGVTVTAPPSRCYFEFSTFTNNLGTIQAAPAYLSVSGSPTFPPGATAWSAAAADARYGANSNILGTAAFHNFPEFQPANANLSNYATLPTNTFQPANANLTNWAGVPTNLPAYTSQLGSAAFSNSLVFQPANANLTNYAQYPTNSFQSASGTLSNWSTVGTNTIVYQSQIGTAAASNTSAFQASSANLTNFALYQTNAFQSANGTLSNWSGVGTNLVVYQSQIGTAAASNTSAFYLNSNPSNFVSASVTNTSIATNDPRAVSLTNNANVFHGAFSGDGSGLTNLPAVGSGLTTNDSRAVNWTNQGSTITGAFTGNGGALTNLTAANLTGTVPIGNLPASVVTSNFSPAVSLANAGNAFTGAFTGNGAGLTNIPFTGLYNGTNTINIGGNALSGAFNGINLNFDLNQSLSIWARQTNTANLIGYFTNSGMYLVAGQYNGSGAGLTSVPATALSGIAPSNNLPANLTTTNDARAQTWTNKGNAITGAFTGNGAGLTNVDITNLTSPTMGGGKWFFFWDPLRDALILTNTGSDPSPHFEIGGSVNLNVTGTTNFSEIAAGLSVDNLTSFLSGNVHIYGSVFENGIVFVDTPIVFNHDQRGLEGQVWLTVLDGNFLPEQIWTNTTTHDAAFVTTNGSLHSVRNNALLSIKPSFLSSNATAATVSLEQNTFSLSLRANTWNTSAATNSQPYQWDLFGSGIKAATNASQLNFALTTNNGPSNIVATLDYNGVFTAASFIGAFLGNGSGLTSIPYSALTGINTNLFILTNDPRAVDLTNLANVFTGVHNGNGAGLTNLPVTSIPSLNTNTFIQTVSGTGTNFKTSGTNVLAGINLLPMWSNTGLANGNDQDVSFGTNNFVRFTGPSAAFATVGFAGGTNGAWFVAINATTNAWTIPNESPAESTSANRIKVPGGDIVLSNQFSMATFWYDNVQSRWIVSAVSGQSVFTNCFFSGTFAGNGAGLTNLSPTGFTPTNTWNLNGNAGTATSAIIGTTDLKPLQLGANNIVVARFDQSFSGSPNLIVGYGAGGNTISALNGNSVLGGGNNGITALGSTTALYCVIAGGFANTVQDEFSFIGGGESNFVTGQFSAIPGGAQNTATNYSFAAGERASATNNNSFVWNDGESALGAGPNNNTFNTTTTNQFLIHAVNGVGINTNSNGTNSLSVYGSITAQYVNAQNFLSLSNNTTGPTGAQLGANGAAFWASNGTVYCSISLNGSTISTVKQIAP